MVENAQEQTKSLVVKLSALGDVLQALSVLPYLPKGRVDWVCEAASASLLSLCPGIERVITLDIKKWKKTGFRHKATRSQIALALTELRKRKYDYIFDLQGNTKSGVVTFFSRGRHKVGLAWKDLAEAPNFLFTHHHIPMDRGKDMRQRYCSCIENFVKTKSLSSDYKRFFTPSWQRMDGTLKKTVDELVFTQNIGSILAPGSAWKNKRLSKECCNSIIQWLKEEGVSERVGVIWGDEAEYTFARELVEANSNLVLIDRVQLPQLAYLLSRVQFVISSDSLPLHLAYWVNTPTFSLFGPSSARIYAPDAHAFWQGTCPYGVHFNKRCPVLRTCETGACLSHFPPLELKRALQMFLREKIRNT